MYTIYYPQRKDDSRLLVNLNIDYFCGISGFNHNMIEDIKKLKTNQSIRLFGCDEQIYVYKQPLEGTIQPATNIFNKDKFQQDRVNYLVLDLLNFIADIKENGCDEHEKISYEYSFLHDKILEDMENGREITYKQVMGYLNDKRNDLYRYDDSFVWGE